MAAAEVGEGPGLGASRSAGGVGAILARQASNLGIGGLAPSLTAEPVGEDMYDCAICFMSKPVTSRFAPFPECTHDADAEICSECYQEAIEFDIANGKVNPGVECCAEGCSHVLTDAQVSGLVSPTSLTKYHKFKASAGDVTLRECSKCGNTQPGDASAPIMTCAKCSSQYCFFHATAHAPTEEACKEYHRKHRAEQRQNIALLNKTAGSCPSCKAVTEKSTGCNHMTCRCGTEWCWLCGQDISGAVGWHYGVGNPLGCPNMMMSGGAVNSRRELIMARMKEQGTWRWRVRLFLTGIRWILLLPIALAFLLLGIALMMAIGLALLPVMLCCGIPMSRNGEPGRNIIIAYFSMLICSPCIIAGLILVTVANHVQAFCYMTLCCRTPPPPSEHAQAAAAAGGDGARLRFGATGGEAMQTDVDKLAAMDSQSDMDGAAMPATMPSATGASAAAGASAAGVPTGYGDPAARTGTDSSAAAHASKRDMDAIDFAL